MRQIICIPFYSEMRLSCVSFDTKDILSYQLLLFCEDFCIKNVAKASVAGLMAYVIESSKDNADDHTTTTCLSF